MVTLFVQNNMQKNLNAKHAVKTEISMKTISINDSAKRSVISPASGPMTPNSIYDVVGNMAIATNVDTRGYSSHRKRRY